MHPQHAFHHQKVNKRLRQIHIWCGCNLAQLCYNTITEGENPNGDSESCLCTLKTEHKPHDTAHAMQVNFWALALQYACESVLC